MDVLQHARHVVGHLDAQQSRIFSFHAAGRSATVQRALDQRQLELEAQDDVQVVGRLVGLDADQRAARTALTARRARRRRRLRAAGQVLAQRGSPRQNGARAADEVLPQPALGLVDAERDAARPASCGRAPGRLRLVEPVAELVQGANSGQPKS